MTFELMFKELHPAVKYLETEEIKEGHFIQRAEVTAHENKERWVGAMWYKC